MNAKCRDYIEAARVPSRLKPQVFGLWSIVRLDLSKLPSFAAKYHRELNGGFDQVTFLKRMTMATLHMDGETVMEDSLIELSRHLPIWLHARGSVLVTGLGLGCVVRGLLHNPDVEHITVIELDRHILRIVGHEFQSNPRVELIQGDALKWQIGKRRFDFAWHDIWFPDNEGLHAAHFKMIVRFSRRIKKQGAWGLPRFLKRSCADLLLK